MTSVILLAAIAMVGAIALYVVARCFHVDEDPRIAQVEELLPGANCGACGYKGCHDFAVNCVGATSLQGMYCPGAGAAGMAAIADCLGLTAVEATPRIAVVRCAGDFTTKVALDTAYQGPRTCAIMHNTVGEYACLASCLGCGDCVAACPFGAIKIDGATPVVDPDACTGCGKCAAACPRSVIEIRNKGKKIRDSYRRVWVACSNCQRGAITRRQCSVGCLGCGLCVKACPFDAIAVTNNLARIDGDKCRTCGKCVTACPVHAIKITN